MDKHCELNGSKQAAKRPRWLTLCMMATAASVIVLSGCGDDEETAPLEQDNGSGQSSSLEQEPAMEQDPGLDENSGSEGSMTQSTGAESEEPMSESNLSDSNASEESMTENRMAEEGTSENSMPEDTMDEPATGTMNPDEDEAGFGEGTDPMPGDSNDTVPNADEDDEVTTNQ